MKYLYGPVKSRRLGNSLGISLTPYKFCSFDCVYCQLGKTTNKTVTRIEYVDIEKILSELRELFAGPRTESKDLDYITLSGFGEPTLNTKIGDLIGKIKQMTEIPVAVLTNSTLLSNEIVRKELLQADLIIPSLDAVTDNIFQRIDRPDKHIKINDIIDGLVALRAEFKGKIWLEIMLVKGMNDDLKYMQKFKSVINMIKPDKVQLNSPIRLTSEEWIKVVDRRKREKIREILGDKCEII